VSPSGGSVVTIGTYDGVHLGHQRLIGEAKSEADRLGLRSVVVTFDRHPSETIRPHATTKLLTDLDLKLELIEALGVDEVVVLTFDRERAQQSPEEFAESLVTDLEASAVVVGENFRFGHDNRGDLALLKKLGRDLGFSARGITLVTDDTSRQVVSSGRIRRCIAEGSLRDARHFLGRPFELRGVWSGDGTITSSENLCRPPAGAYEVSLRLPGRPMSAGTVQAVVGPDTTVRVTSSVGASEIDTDRGVVGLCFLDPA
jgi:riboflavin kinase/FMN adenylyltransferase